MLKEQHCASDCQ